MSVFIIAEAGVNHNGSVTLAKQLIDVASDSGADAVKFQTFKAENLVSKNLVPEHFSGTYFPPTDLKSATGKTTMRWILARKYGRDLCWKECRTLSRRSGRLLTRQHSRTLARTL